MKRTCRNCGNMQCENIKHNCGCGLLGWKSAKPLPSRAAIRELVKIALRCAPHLSYIEACELGRATEKVERQMRGKR